MATCLTTEAAAEEILSGSSETSDSDVIPVASDEDGSVQMDVSPMLVTDSDNQEQEDEDSEPFFKAAFMEVFSPPRVGVHVRKAGMRTAGSYDITTGTDLLGFAGRAVVLHALTSDRPAFTMVSPPCRMYSSLMWMFNFPRMSEEHRSGQQAEADCMLDFAMHVCRIQHQQSGFWCFEHPQKALSWSRDSVQQMLALPGVQTVSFDQCRVGLCLPGSSVQEHPIKKRTKLMTNSTIVQALFSGLQCQCQVPHVRLLGTYNGVPLSQHAQRYTPRFCELLCECAVRHAQGEH